MALPSVDPARASTQSSLRVRFCDTDLMGIVHHGNYLAYFEAGRVEWLRRRGVAYRDWAARGFHLAVIEANVRYRLPALFDDEVTVETTLAELRHASLRFEYKLLRGETLLTEGMTRLACVDDNNRVGRFPADMLEILSRGETS
jgi:acyl-CoA thioester hydrolase